MAETEGKPKGSSWRRWAAASEGEDEPAPSKREPAHARAERDEPAAPAADDLDVTLRWPSAEAPDGVEPDAEPDVAAEPEPADLDDAAPAGTWDDWGDESDRFDDADEAAELLPVVPLLPAIAGRVDALDGHLRALAMRLDVLASSSAALRTALGERIDGYAEAAAAAARRGDDAIEEHRRSTERQLIELRRGIDAHDDSLRRVSGRIEELATDVTTLLDVARRPAPTASTPAPPAPVDVSGIEARLDELADLLATPPAASPPPAPASVDLAGLELRLDELSDLVAAMPAPAPAVPAPAPVDVSGIEARLARLEAAVERIAGLVEVVVDTMPASAEGTGTELADRVAEAVAARLEGR